MNPAELSLLWQTQLQLSAKDGDFKIDVTEQKKGTFTLKIFWPECLNWIEPPMLLVAAKKELKKMSLKDFVL